MIQSVLLKLVERRDLTREEAGGAMEEIMTGMATESQVAAFLVGLRMKGESPEEIAGCAQVMRAKSTKISTRHTKILDTCGTGGDQSGTFNISTASAIVAAAAGVPVAKHGNRAVSSRSGSADVLRALGVNIELTPEQAGRVLDDVGITFLFAPHLHQAMKYAVNVRKDLALRTVFNILGPLTNPAGAQHQVLGVYTTSLTSTMAAVLCQLGSRRAIVVHGVGGLDELSTFGETQVSEVRNGAVSTYMVRPEDFGFRSTSLHDLQGGDAVRNAEIIRSVVNGTPGPCRDIVALNAGAGLYAAEEAASIADGARLAERTIDKGEARRFLDTWIEATRSFS